MKIQHKYQELFRDIALLIASIAAAAWFARSGFAETWMLALAAYVPLASFVAGFFFTSLFTLAPASIALAALGEFNPHVWVAFWGAAGAVVGDLLLFLFVRDHISDNLEAFFSGRRFAKLRKLFRRPFLHWLLPVSGALVIASPLPDELGLAMMGISRISMATFVPISYAMNFLGILLVQFVAGKAL